MPTRARAPVLADITIPSSLLPLAPSGRATGIGVATEVVVFMTSVVASAKPAVIAAIVVVIVSVVNVPGTNGTTRISEYKTAASKSNQRTDCKVISEAESESAVFTARAAVAGSAALPAGASTSLVLRPGERAVELVVATAVAVSIFVRLVRLLATDSEAALTVVQGPSLSQITAGEMLWCRR